MGKSFRPAGNAAARRDRDAFARLCRLHAPRLLAAIARRLERDALPCDAHEVLAEAMARMQRSHRRGGARSWQAAAVALASDVVDERVRWMAASSLPRPGWPA